MPITPNGGAAGQELIRLAPAAFADGIGAMVEDRPNARVVSNEILQQDVPVPSSPGLSNLFWAWGQFVDHDIDLTQSGATEPVPILAPADDPVFSEGTPLAFTRVEPVEGTGIDTPRSYRNEITAFLDASMIYGSDDGIAEGLRSGAHVLMDTDGLLVGDGLGGVFAGDIRAAENVALTSLQTLFVREHNRWVDDLAATRPDLSESELFDAARMRVEAEIQAITFREWLPILVGDGALPRYDGYDSDIDPGVSVEFSTAAFRFGHSLLPPDLSRLEEDGTDIAAGALPLDQAFFNPDAIVSNGGLDPLLRGLADGVAQELDAQVVEEVRSFLFSAPGETGLDLAAANIQRGRDLGLASYNDLRASLGLGRAETFADVTPDAGLAAKLEDVYGDVDLLDPWVGGLAEDPSGAGIVGELFATVIVDQFARIRAGDPFWSQAAGGLSAGETRTLWQTTLADVIEANTGIAGLQDAAFLAHDRIGGTAGDDALAGAAGRDLLLGEAGDDVLGGAAGNDQLDGGTGQDTIDGGPGDDLLYGGPDDDRFLFLEGSGHDVIADYGPGDSVSVDVDDPAASQDLTQSCGEMSVTLILGHDRSITWLGVTLAAVEDGLTFV